MLRLLLWRILGFVAVLTAVAVGAWLLSGGLGATLRGTPHDVARHPSLGALASGLGTVAIATGRGLCSRGFGALPASLAIAAACALASAWRLRVRRARVYVRLELEPFRGDSTSAEGVIAMFHSLHKRLLRRWWRRLVRGQPSLALELHHSTAARAGGSDEVWLALSCPAGLERMATSALRSAYPNCRLRPARERFDLSHPAMLRLKKELEFTRCVKTLDRFEHEREPPVNRLLTIMAMTGEPVTVQLALTPAPLLWERHARRVYRRREDRLSRERRGHLQLRDRSMLEDAELRSDLQVQHQPLFFTDLRVLAPSRSTCEQIASELRADGGENRLIERGTVVRRRLLDVYRGRLERGEGNPLPSCRRGVFACTELAALWHLPSIDFVAAPFARNSVPRAPAPPAIMRPANGTGTLRDALGPVTVHPQMRKQNTAVPGAVEQGKSSYLVATVAEDLLRERCAVIVLDPKGDAAEASLGLVAAQRTCTLLDFANPTCGFNPLAVDAPADVIADYVVGALKNLFTDADIRASSDRYLRNAIIAVLAYDRRSTLWDAARLLSVGEEGYAYRSAVSKRVLAMPALREIFAFFTTELTAQLADARSTTTAKLDAPVNKLARLLNSPSIKRVLLNESLAVDFDRVIAQREVLVVKGALGAMGPGNTSVLMQLLVGMLDAALGRQQDLVAPHERVAVALKIDEAPLVLNRGFAETLALKRSAGLETVACWQTDAQWTDPQVREQLDALFAHRVYFATSSAAEARAAVPLTMAQFSDTVRPGAQALSALGRPDTRLHLPKHHAIASWLTPQGRQAPFVAQTIPLQVDHGRVRLHLAAQAARGGRHLSDLRQPHWDSGERLARTSGAITARSLRTSSRQLQPQGQGAAPGTLAELVVLGHAHTVRRAPLPPRPRALTPEPLDLEMLTLIAKLPHILTSQIHRRFNSQRAMTTTQRRLKRLSDAGLTERVQFHQRDGGGAPMCHVITRAGLGMLREHAPAPGGEARDARHTLTAPGGEGDRDRHAPQASAGGAPGQLRQARRDARVAGCVLALDGLLGSRGAHLRWPGDCLLAPPRGERANATSTIGPAELRLSNGRTPRGFLRTSRDGRRAEVEHFQAVRPQAIVAAQEGFDVMVELDDRLSSGAMVAKLERYDHFLSGWCEHTRRYSAGRVGAVVVFVCRDRARAREYARRADRVLCACRAYAGEYPVDWQYPGRDGILFASERDIHEGLTTGYCVPSLPPEVRVQITHGDPRASRCRVVTGDILAALAAGGAGA